MASKTVSLLKLIASRGMIVRGIGPSSSQASVDAVEQIFGTSSEDGVGSADEAPNDEEDVVDKTSMGPNGDEAGLGSTFLRVAMTNTIRLQKEFSREYWRALVSKKKTDDSSNLQAGGGDGSPSSVSDYFAESPAITVGELPQAIRLQTLVTEETYRYYAQ